MRHLDNLRNRLNGETAQGAMAGLALRVLNLGLRFLTGLILARTLGASNYGAYAFAIALVSLLSVPAVLGLDNVALRELAILKSQSRWSHIRGLLIRSHQIALSLSVALAVAVAAILAALGDRVETGMSDVIWLALLLLPLLNLGRLEQNALIGLRHVVVAQTPDNLVRPFTFLVLVGSGVVLGLKLDAMWTVGFQLAATLGSVALALWFLLRHLPTEIWSAPAAYQTATWLRSGSTFCQITILQSVNAVAGVLVAGFFLGSAQAGIFSIAFTATGLIKLVLASVNMSIASRAASLYAAHDLTALQALATRSARAIFVVSLPIGLVFLTQGELLLSLFGSDYVVGTWALALLTIGELFNAAMGSVGLFLSVTGHERDTRAGLVLGTCVYLGLMPFLVPLLGITGTAAASACSTVAWNILLARRVQSRVGIRTHVLAGSFAP
jgi:O-antigen/teichoic acid export membrane protein